MQSQLIPFRGVHERVSLVRVSRRCREPDAGVGAALDGADGDVVDISGTEMQGARLGSPAA